MINKPQEQYENEQKQKERCFLEYVCNLSAKDRNEFFLKYEKINGTESLEKLKQKAREVWKLSQKDKAK